MTHPTDFACQYPKTSYHCASNDTPMTSVANFWWIWWSKTFRVFFSVIDLLGFFFCTHHIYPERKGQWLNLHFIFDFRDVEISKWWNKLVRHIQEFWLHFCNPSLHALSSRFRVCIVISWQGTYSSYIFWVKQVSHCVPHTGAGKIKLAPSVYYIVFIQLNLTALWHRYVAQVLCVVVTYPANKNLREY